MYEYSETAKQVFGVGELFLAPLFFLNYFLLNLFLFLQKKWGGGGGGEEGGGGFSLYAVPGSSNCCH